MRKRIIVKCVVCKKFVYDDNPIIDKEEVIAMELLTVCCYPCYLELKIELEG